LLKTQFLEQSGRALLARCAGPFMRGVPVKMSNAAASSRLFEHLFHSNDVLKKGVAQLRSLAICFALLLLTSCASSYKPVPDDYTGPTATISDSGIVESQSKAQLFAVTAIDGNPIANSFGATAHASAGQGLRIIKSLVERQVPAHAMKITLEASHTTGAPIHALFSQAAGTFFSVKGTLDFTPKPGGKYVVKGELKKDGSSVWLEDAETHQLVTEKVRQN